MAMVSDNGISWGKHEEYHEAQKGLISEVSEHDGYMRRCCKICGKQYIIAIGAPNPLETCGLALCESLAEANKR